MGKRVALSASTRNTAHRCLCGKVGWPSEEQAADVVVRAKVAFSLHGKANRREQRVYRCDRGGGLFHVTSQPDRDQTEPWWDPTDDTTARDFLIRAIYADDPNMRAQLLAPDYLDQTLRVLDDLNAGLARQIISSQKREEESEQSQEDISQHNRVVYTAMTQLSPWRKAAQSALRRRNVAETETQNREKVIQFMAMLRTLAVGIAKHERTNVDVGPADVDLYRMLDELRMPREGPTLRELVESGVWQMEAETPI